MILGKNELLDFVRNMRARDHVIMFYTDQKDKHLVLFTYLTAGLDAGEAAIYVAGEESSHQIREAMKSFGLDVEYYEGTGALRILDYRDWYITGGQFDIGRTISLWKKSLDEALARGFKGLRVTGEMAFFFRHNMVHELIQYERALHRVLKIPLSAICAYDDTVVVKGARENQYLMLYLNLISAHSTILFLGPEEAGMIKVV